VDIKSASVADLDLLCDLRRGLYIRDPGSIDEARDRVTLQELITTPELGVAGLIISANEVAGYVLVTFCFSVEFGGRFALIDELFLSERFRRQGIGGKVLDQLAERLRQAETGAMRLEVARANVGAEKLYRRHGFEPHDRYLMTKWLDRPGKNG
jgi:ribosomal protein S18 acetylase RimI-like enzyme